MTVYNIQQVPWYRWWLPYAASAAGNFMTDYAKGVIDRANNAKQVDYIKKFNESYYPNITNDMSAADMSMAAATNPYYARMNQTNRAMVDAQIKARADEGAKRRFAQSLMRNSDPQIIGAAIAEGNTAQTQPQGPVGSGNFGNNYANMIIAARDLGLDPSIIKQAGEIAVPKYDTKTIDSGGQTDIIQTSPYATGFVNAGSFKKTQTPDNIADNQRAIQVANITGEYGNQRERIANSGKMAVARYENDLSGGGLSSKQLKVASAYANNLFNEQKLLWAQIKNIKTADSFGRKDDEAIAQKNLLQKRYDAVSAELGKVRSAMARGLGVEYGNIYQAAGGGKGNPSKSKIGKNAGGGGNAQPSPSPVVDVTTDNYYAPDDDLNNFGDYTFGITGLPPEQQKAVKEGKMKLTNDPITGEPVAIAIGKKKK